LSELNIVSGPLRVGSKHFENQIGRIGGVHKDKSERVIKSFVGEVTRRELQSVSIAFALGRVVSSIEFRKAIGMNA
jgi:hypothetical protein